MIDQDFFDDTEERMKKTIEATRREFAVIRTGRATPALVERIMVDAYGTAMPIQQMASIGVPEARLLVIQPWDKSVIGDIEKAIHKSDLGINPSTDGNVIRLVFPSLTEERRKELVKVVRRKTEEGKVALRNIRRDVMDFLKEMEKEGEASEDEVHRAQERIQKVTDKWSEELEKLQEAKEKEILEV